MSDLWNYRAVLKDRAQAVARHLEQPGVRLCVQTEPGAGRHSLAIRLAKLSDIALIEVPPFEDADAPLHLVIQLASHAGMLGDIAARRNEDVSTRARSAAETLAADGRAVAIVLPIRRAALPHENEEASRRQIDAILVEVSKVETLRIALLTPSTLRLRGIFPSTVTEHFAAPQVGFDAIDASGLQEPFKSAARRLATWMKGAGWASTPFEARLQVGLVALGVRPDELAMRLDGLARKMAQQLTRMPPLATAVRRLLVARHALPVSEVEKLCVVQDHWLPLLTTCIGYGDEEVRVPEITRHVLLDALTANQDDTADAHEVLATYHQGLDGATKLGELGSAEALHWMEKVHHLALGGPATAARWAEQEPVGREQLWERARYLSRECKRWADAAALYRTCIETFGPDPYSKHYLAYNLDRSNGSRSEIRECFQDAVTHDRANPWWQQRWIRYLIAHGTVEEARAAWRDAIRAIDPTGTRIRRSAWLAINLHGMVARRWLAVGRLEDARAVLEDVPREWLEKEPELRELIQTIISQEQDLFLGESVYPASVPLEERWRAPRALRKRRSGHDLIWWAPGRVVEADACAVTIVIAPTPNEAQQLTYDGDRWRTIAGEPPEDAAGFFELGRYENGEEALRWLADADEDVDIRSEDVDLLARLASWIP